MYKAILVDDEKQIREGISSLVNWNSYGFELIGGYMNGKEVIESFKVMVPDLVITDIKMPMIDGIELSKIIQSEYPNVKVIVLTSYSDFDYAQKAIKFGVADFIIKNDFMKELPLALSRISEWLDTSRLGEIGREDSLRSLLKRFFFEDDTGAIERCRVFLSEEFRYYVCTWELQGLLEEEVADPLVIIKNFFDRSLKDYDFELCIEDNRSVLFIIEKNGLRGMDYLVSKMNNLLLMFEEFMRLSIKIGISSCSSDLTQLNAMYEQAQKALSTINRKGNVLAIYEDRKEIGNKRIDIDDFLAKMDQYIRMQKELSTNDFMEQILHNSDIDVVNLIKYKLDAFIICSSLIRKYIQYDSKSVLNDFEASLLERIEETKSISSVNRVMVDTMNAIIEVYKGQDSNKHSIVKKVDRYIYENISQSITLQDISNVLYLNGSYISRTYKKYAGLTVTEAILKEKMEVSKVYLKNKKLMIYEVAEMVGFNDPAYFTNVFSKYCGCSPSDYRKQNG